MSSSVMYDEKSHAHITTNEDLRMVLGFFMPKDCNRVLTVAASGDHPLFCSLYGAKHVDTFDITQNAKLIMDIKIAAIGLLNRDEYARMLENLWWRDDALTAPFMDKVSEKLPASEYEYLCSMRGTRLFNKDTWDGRDSKYLPNVFEYKQLQKIIKQPYKFVQTDIVNLSAHLNQSYDFIHLSNIFDHINNPELHWDIIQPLLKRLNVGGRLVSYSLFGYPKQFSKDSMKNTKLIESILKDYNLKCYLTGLTNMDTLTVFERIG